MTMAASVAPTAVQNKSPSPSKLTSHNAPSAALQAVGSRPRQAQRRPTKQASYELANHAKAYLEGGQFASGYDFLYSLLAAGTSISTPAQPYVGLLAPPAYLSLASSLIAYPHVTTKAQSKDATKGADAALRYLHCVQTTVDDPAYPTLRKAFTFPEERNRRRAPGYRSAAGSLSPEPGGDIERIAGVAANTQSLWYRAEDFWHIVGWAFNCSVEHKKRWDRWKLWLSNILDFLEADWDVCVRQDNNKAGQEAMLQESLLWNYIVGDAESTNRGMRRRIVKAILSIATPESRKEYPEVWEKETAEPRRRTDSDHKVGEVDFETGEVADYESDEEMQDATEQASDNDESEGSLSHSSDKGIRSVYDAAERLGGQDAIHLRQRLIALLAQVAQALPTRFTTLSDFFDNVLEDFIQLPTIIFQVLLSTLEMPGHLQVAFNANLLLPLVSGTLPDYLRYDPIQDHFEATLLPLRGTTQSFAANAKVTLILEQMFMYMTSQNALKPTNALRKAMESGIEARNSVYGTGRGKRGNADEEEQAKHLLEASSDRLLGLLEILEISAGKTPQPPKAKGKDNAVVSFATGSPLSSAPDSDTELDD